MRRKVRRRRSQQKWRPNGCGGAFYYTFDEQRIGWTDGQTVRDLLPPYSLHFPQCFVDLGDRTLFFATRQISETESGPWIWSSDGTPGGTSPVAAAVGATGVAGYFLFQEALVPDLGEVRYLVQQDFPRTLSKLSTTDGTAAGTRELERILFSADDGEHGRELWVSDGTAEGTRLLEILPGPRGSYPQEFRVAGDRVVFAADDGVHGLEPWVTDGTPEGTHLVADVMPGPRASSPRHFEVFGDELFFNAGRPQEGYELWKLPLTELEP